LLELLHAVLHAVQVGAEADHIGAAGQFAETATYVGHEATAELLTRSNDPNRPVPTVTFTDSYELTLGDQTLQLDYHGNNHEPGNSFIYALEQKVLMVVDIVFPGWVPFADLALAEVDFMAIAEEVGFENPWALFEVYFAAVARECAEATIPVWQERLGGTDVFTEGHCAVMMESLQVD
jgi:hypothetical protein